MATLATYTFDVAILNPTDYVRSRSQDLYSVAGDGSTATPWIVADQTIQAWLNDGNNENEVAAMVCEAMAMRYSQLASSVTQVDLKLVFTNRAQQCTDNAKALRTMDRSDPSMPGNTGAGFGQIFTPELRDYPDLLPGQRDCSRGIGPNEGI